MKREILYAIMFLFCIHVHGQRKCGSELNLTEMQQTDPARYQRIMDLENRIQKSLNDPVLRSTQQSTIYVPVVVHIVYNNYNTQNLSDAQVHSQIQVLNEDYRRLNADRAKTPSAFVSVAGDANIQFVLAKKDPLGNPTTGITRTITAQNKFYAENESVKFSISGGKNAWNPQKYLNIWVCNIWYVDPIYGDQQLAGYAQFPDELYTKTNTDGVVINYKYFGRDGSAVSPYNKGRTATHEIGHWLNLRHIWGDEYNCTATDFVNDTPNQFRDTQGCPAFPKVDNCSPSNPGIMFMNYMDYSDDACMNMFTNGQIERMRAVFDTQRWQMLTYSHCHNGIQDGNETSVDCGGSCPPCPATCYDGIKNQNETGIDCGGVCPPCVIETCNDGIKNQNETGIDCGGVCPPCGIGGNLDNTATAGACQCGDAGTLPINNPNSLFSGKNIFDANNIKLSHGSYYNILSSTNTGGYYRCRDIAYNTKRESGLDGGIFFEENNVQFCPDKMYKLSFNYWIYKDDYQTRGGPIHLKLANGLVNKATKREYHYYAGHPGYFWKADGDIWESFISTIPLIAKTFYIGYVKYIENHIGCRYYYDDFDYRYTEVSIIFQPDNFYSQFWIMTERYEPINSFKIQEMCFENFVYNNKNSQYIQNPTRASNTITFENIDYKPTNTVEFIAGNTIIFKGNVSITPPSQGAVIFRLDKNVCLNNTLPSFSIDGNSSTETLPPSTTSIDEIKTVQFDGINIYPNPTTGIINITVSDNTEIKAISIFDISGRILKNDINFTENILDLSYLNNGTYFLKILMSFGQTIHKVTIKK